MDYKEFAQKIKAKYPDYDDMDDRQLAEKMVAKYPEYSDVTFDSSPEQQPEPEKKGGFLSDVVQGAKDIVDPIVDNAKGLVSGVQKEAETGGTRYGQAKDPLSKLTAIGGTAARIGGQVLAAPVKLATDETKNFLENIPGYNSGVATLDKKADIGPALSKLGGLAAKAKESTYDRLPNAGKDLVDIGVNTLGFPVLKAEAKPLLGAANRAAENIGKDFGSAANRIQGTKVKINMPEMKKGAANELYGKYEVFGNAKETTKQWNDKLSDVAGKLNDKLQTSAQNPDNYADINQIFEDAKSTLLKGKSKTAQIELEGSLDNLKKTFNTAYPEGKINILEAQIEKQHVGKKGDWLNKNGAVSGNPTASIDAQAHNALYDALKKNVENKGSEGIKELNKQLSEMIPMERASSKQMLVENRKNPISLDDYLGALSVASSAATGNLLPAAIAGVNMASKSPNVAKSLYSTGKGLKSLATKNLSEYFRRRP